MWERFANWLRGLFGIKREDIATVADNILVSDPMWDALAEWNAAFYNKPGWAKSPEFITTKFPGMVTSFIATLSAAEIKLSSGSGARADWVQEQIEKSVMNAVRNHIQKAAALSYVAIKPFVDGKNIYCDISTPDGFWPTEIKGGQIQSGIFVDTATVKVGSKKTAYIRLEEHTLDPDGVRITNRAYKADNVKAGAELPLTTVPEWAELLPEVLVAGVDRPLFAVLQMPFANQVDPTSDLPVSLYANAMQSFMKIDRLYNDFLWEMESGRRKQIFDVTAVQQSGQTAGSTDLAKYKTTDQYLVLDMGDTDKPYDDYTPDMRVEAYQSAINLQVRLMESQIGVSTGTFDFDVKSGIARAKTATEVLSDDTDTYNTIKGIQENGLKQGLIDLVQIFDIYATLYSLAPSGTIQATVEFGDSIFEDTGTEFLRRKALADGGYIPKWQMNAWYFAEDETEAKKSVAEAQAEQTQSAAGLFRATPLVPGGSGV